MPFVHETQSLLLKGNGPLYHSDFRIKFAQLEIVSRQF